METLDIEGSVMKIELKSEKFIQNNSEQFAQDKALSLNLENLQSKTIILKKITWMQGSKM